MRILVEWLDRIVQYPKRFYMNNNEDGTVTLIEAPGTVAVQGTPVNATNLNAMRSAINDALIRSFTFTESGVWLCPPGVYSIDAWVVGAGGKGGYGYADNSYPYSGGGGGGGYCNLFKSIPVIPGNVYIITVGASNGAHSQFNISDYRSNGGANGSSATTTSHGAGGIGGNNGGSQLTDINGGGGDPSTINPYDGLPYAGGGGAGGTTALAAGNGGICGGGGGGRRVSPAGNGGIGYNLLPGGDNAKSGTYETGANGASFFGGGGGGGPHKSSGYSTSGGDGGSGVVILYYRQEFESVGEMSSH